MKRLILITFSFLLFGGGTLSAQTKNMREVFLKDLDYLYKMGKEIYCYWDLKKEREGIDWDVLYAQARAEMEQAGDVQEYYGILRMMLAGVHDGHVGAYPRTDDVIYLYYMPIRFREVDGGAVVVDAVKPDAFLGDLPLSRGDRLLAINGTPTEEAIAAKMIYMEGSTEQMRRRRAVAWLGGWLSYTESPARNPVLTLERESGAEEVEVPWLIYDAKIDPSRKEEKQDYQIRQFVEAKILPGNIGYLRLNSMMSPLRPEEYIRYVTAQFETLLKTDAVIIDVRGNGGGWSDVGDALTRYLIDHPTVRIRIAPRLSAPLLMARPQLFRYFEGDEQRGDQFAKWRPVILQPVESEKRYRGKTALLIDAGCFSACDTFADGLAANNLALTVGEATGGGTGYPLKFGLPSGLTEVRFSTTQGYSNAGRQLEGIGTIPDIYIQPTREDIRERKDAVLLKTYTMLLNNLSTSPNVAAGNVSFPLSQGGVKPAFIEESEAIEQSHFENAFLEKNRQLFED